MKQIFVFGIIIINGFTLLAQQKVGINTQTPLRTLDVVGEGAQYIRVHTNTAAGGSGLELIRGTNVAARDWKFMNDNGNLRIVQSEDNFATSDEVVRFNGDGYMGIGTTVPTSTLHIAGGNQLSSGGHGYLTLGTQSFMRMSFDNHTVQARDNNASSELLIQAYGGDTHFGSTGGRTFMAMGIGKVLMGNNDLSAKVNIESDNFQMYLRNDEDDVNDWYIGASDNEWLAGDNQLLFSPTSNSNDAVLRLMSVTENDGNNAPVMIRSSATQALLLDGNEIDTRDEPLYINHNSDQNTLLNPSGGRVGIATSSPQATVHVNGISGTPNLSLQTDNVVWHVNTSSGNGDLTFSWGDLWLASINDVNGQWLTASDARLKENILPLQNTLESVKKLKIYNYAFKHDSLHTRHIGLLAQELNVYFPEVVKQQEDGQYGVTYAHLAVIALKAIQEQQQLIVTLRGKLQRLKAEHAVPSANTQTTDLSPIKSR